MRRAAFGLIVVLATALAVTGCSTADPLAEQYQDGSGQGYISGDGAYTEIEPADRDDPIQFSGTDENGDTISSDDLAGDVFVVNFWYAGCPPCRTEAPDLAALATEYTEVPFVGVNTIDTVENATTFATKFGIPYPSIIDATTASVQLAFAGAGAVAPNAVPTTLVMDREGRVAARISGVIRDKSILASMIDRVVAEEN